MNAQVNELSYEERKEIEYAANKAEKKIIRKKMNAVANILGGAFKELEFDGDFCRDLRGNIVLANGASVFIRANGYGNNDRVEVSGNYYGEGIDGKRLSAKDVGALDYNAAEPKMSASLNKSAEQLAKEISRKIIPAYLPVFEKMMQKIAERNAADQKRQSFKDKFLPILQNCENITAKYFGEDYVNLSVDSVNAEQIEKIIAIMNGEA